MGLRQPSLCSTLSGDAPARSCAAYCDAQNPDRYCRHCKCASCPFCKRATSRLPLVLPSTTSKSRLNASLEAVVRIRRRFLGAQGVVIRLWECSLAGCIGEGADPHGNSFIERCVQQELETGPVRSNFGRPASFLRWDVPAALFAGGRCTNPAGHEWDAYTESVANGVLMDANGWQREGFTGHKKVLIGDR